MRAPLLRALFAVLRSLPWQLLRVCGVLLGLIWTYLIPLRRTVMHENLRRVFPEMSASRRRTIIRRCKMHFAMTGLELFWLPRMKEEWLRAHVTVENADLPAQLLKRGRGIICVGGHFGNWEVIGAATAARGFSLSYIVKRIRDPLMDQLVNDSRRSVGVEIIYTRAAGRQVLKALKNSRLVAFLSDQDARSKGVFVDFLGIPASTPMGAAAYALRLGAPMMMIHDLRLPNGDHRVSFREVPISESLTLNDTDLKTVTQTFTTMIADDVRRVPEQWFWMHKRWKSKVESNPQ